MRQYKTGVADTPQWGVNQSSGRLTMGGSDLQQNDPRLWGSVGRNVLDLSTAAPGQQRGEGDPRYYEAYEEDMGDNNTRMAYRLRPEVAERLDGRIQLGQSGIGGYAEANDPSQIQYDPEFGFLTQRDNINRPDNGGMSGFLNDFIVPMFAAGMGGITAAHGGFSGLSSGGGNSFPMVDAPNMAFDPIAAANPALSSAPSAGGNFFSQVLENLMPSGDFTWRDALRMVTQPQGGSGQGGQGWQGGNSAGGSILGDALSYFTRSNQSGPMDYLRMQQEYDTGRWNDALQASRPNQQTPFGSVQWVQDPQTGQWTQTSTLNERDQGRLDQFRGIADQRMQHASQALDPGRQINWAGINPNLGRIFSNLPTFGGKQVGGK